MERDPIDFLGSGWAFPPSFSRHTQQVAMVSNEADIHNSLMILLSTLPGERIMQPAFGCDLNDFLFEPVDTTLLTRMKDRITFSINEFEPRIRPLSVSIETYRQQEGMLEIQVHYEIKATNSRYNLVYPFYLEEGRVKP